MGKLVMTLHCGHSSGHTWGQQGISMVNGLVDLFPALMEQWVC
jgi:hypothetical protein